MDRIICVVGPTASGKTKLAVQLAKLYGGEVVSCDSMQIYKHMDIGTAKPTKEEMEGVHHHLLDMVEPGEDFSAGKYVQLADSCVQDILSRGKTAVIAGGTGLYVDSLIAGRSFAPVPQTGRREALEAQLRENGGEAMLARLRSTIRRTKSALSARWRSMRKPARPSRSTIWKRRPSPRATGPCGWGLITATAPFCTGASICGSTKCWKTGCWTKFARCSPSASARRRPPCRPSAIKNFLDT